MQVSQMSIPAQNPAWIIQFPINAGLYSNPVPGKFPYGQPFAFYNYNGVQYDYYWIFCLACIAAFTMAMSNGANDVANSFATSVGSRALKMWHALLIASFCEFFGAYLLGNRVTDAIRSKIINSNQFKNHDDLLMFGMLVALIVVTIWVFTMSYFEMPVSITHSIIGAIIGFALCSPGGGSTIDWSVTSGMGKVFVSWVASPGLSAVICFILYSLVRRFVLRHENSFERALLFFPLILTLCLFINCFFIIFNGVTSFNTSTGQATIKGVGGQQSASDAKTNLDLGTGFGIAIGISFGLGLLMMVVGRPLLRRFIGNLSDEDVAVLAVQRGIMLSENEFAMIKDKVQDNEDGTKGNQDDAHAQMKTYTLLEKLSHQPEIDRAFKATPYIQSIHDKAEKFPIRTELAFSFMQILTACFASFAHGSNDVANSVGPLSAVVAIYLNPVGTETVSNAKATVPIWVLLIGCFGLVAGLALYGHKVISSMGHKMTHITPARGFCAELSFSLVVVTGSFLGLPLSTTHCIVGAIAGLGLAESRWRETLNYKFLFVVFGSWVATLLICLVLSATLYSFVVFAPSQYAPLSANNCLYAFGSPVNISQATGAAPAQFFDAKGNVHTDYNGVYSGLVGFAGDVATNPTYFTLKSGCVPVTGSPVTTYLPSASPTVSPTVTVG